RPASPSVQPIEEQACRWFRLPPSRAEECTAMSDHVYVDPDVLLAAAGEIEALVTRLQTSLAVHSPALNVAPSGAEEVSVLAAGYFNRLAGSFGAATSRGIEELAAAAAMLRAQAAAYREEDRTLGTSLITGM
ncbi:PE family protein, partial [Prescottella equi]